MTAALKILDDIHHGVVEAHSDEEAEQKRGRQQLAAFKVTVLVAIAAMHHP
jgi:hypothetical protein